MTSYVASPGQPVSGITLVSGDSLTVTNGGLATSDTADSGAIVTVSSGGTAGTLTVSGTINAFGTLQAVTIAAGGSESLFYGAQAVSSILVDATAYESNATASFTQVSSGSTDTVTQGLSTSATVFAGGEQVINAGSAVATTVGSGGRQDVQQATVTSTAVQSGGLLALRNGGSTVSATISSGGNVLIGQSGTFSGVVSSGAKIAVLPGGVNSGIVQSGGLVASSGVIGLDPVTELTFYGSSAGPTTFGSGAVDYVLSGGTANSATVGSGGLQDVLGGATSGTILAGGAEILLASGVTATGTVVNSGGTLTVALGTASNTVLSGYGATETVAAGAIDSGATVTAQAVLTVSSGGLSVGAFAGSGGSIVGSGTIAGATVLASGTVVDDGVATGGTVQSGGYFAVGNDYNQFQSGTAVGVTVLGGFLVNFNGTASATIVSAGVLQVYASAVGTTVLSGGVLSNVTGVIQGGLIASGGQEIDVGGMVSGLTVGSGGVEVINPLSGIAGGPVVVTGTIVRSGGGVLVQSGAISGTVLSSGGLLVLLPGASATGTIPAGGSTVSTGVIQLGSSGLVALGAVDSPASLGNGQAEYVLTGGLGTGTTVGSGATETVYAGGSASGATVTGGTLTISAGASATSITVSSGALIGAGSTTGLAVSGGLAYLLGTATNLTITGSGNVEVEGGGTATSGSVSGSGVLTVYSATLAGFSVAGGGVIDLDGQGTGTVVSAGGTLTANGTVTGTTVLGSGLETVAGGTESGTVVSSGGVQAVNNGSATATTVYAGGIQTLNFGGVTSGTTIFSGASQILSAGTAIGTIVSGGMLANSAGVTSGAILSAGAEEIVGDGLLDDASAVGTVVGSGATLVVLSGGSLSGTVLESGGTIVLAGGTATNTSGQGGVVDSGAILLETDFFSGGLYVSATETYIGQTESGATIGDNQTETILGSAVATGTIVGSGAAQMVVSGGTASGTILSAGGIAFIGSGGTAVKASVLSGALLGVEPGGIASGTDVQADGLAGALGGGQFVGTTVETDSLFGLLGGGEADGTDVKSNGGFAVLGGLASGTTVENGGVFGIDNEDTGGIGIGATASVGSAVGTTVQAGGYFAPLPGTFVGGLINGGTLVTSGVFVTAPFNSATFYPTSAVNPSLAGFTLTYVGSSGLLSGGQLGSALGLVEAGGSDESIGSVVRVLAGGTVVGLTVDDNSSLVNGGTGSGVVVGTSGTETVTSGGIDSNAVVGTLGTLAVLSGGQALSARVASGGMVIQDDLDAVISGLDLQVGATVMFDSIPFISGSTIVSLDPTTHVLSVSDGIAADTRTVSLAADDSGAIVDVVGAYSTVPSTGDDTYSPLVTLDSIACFLHGTLIATPMGEVGVETLAIGDLVTTADGPARPIRWIGRRSYDRRFVAGNPDVIPIRIACDAIADGVPHTDLLVSPLHAMFVGGVLIPAKLLVNGATITEATDVELIRYVHLELASHDILLANGALSESFVDCDSRGMFQNEAEYAALYPNDPGQRWTFCAPRIEDGQRLEDIRAELAARAGLGTVATMRTGVLTGYLDTVTPDVIRGWAWQPDYPDETVRLDVFVDGGVVAQVVANCERSDVRKAGFGDGRCGFHLTLAKPLSPFREHVIEVRRVGDGEALTHSPQVLKASPLLDAAARKALAAAIQGHASDASAPELEELLNVLVGGADRLLQARARQPAKSAGAKRRRTKVMASGAGPLVLVIDDRMPTPDEDAGSGAVLDHMRSLARLGYRVGFVPRDMAVKGKFSRTLDKSGIMRLGAPYYACVEDVLRQHRDDVELVYVHRVANMTLYGEMVRHVCPKARLVYSVADLHFLRHARQEAIEGEPAAKSRNLREKELRAARLADVVITHSTYETALLGQLLPGLNVHTVPWSFEAASSAIPFSHRAGVAFIGGYDHHPNLDAAAYLVRAVMPLVWRQDPSIDCLLVGSNMPEALRRLTGGRVVAMDHVPDLNTVFDEIRLTVAPLRFGAGLKGKVLQSLAAGVPCACSTIAAEGMALPADLGGLIGRNAAELAALIVSLHNDATKNAHYRAAGIDFVERQFNPDTIDGLMKAVVMPQMNGLCEGGAASTVA